MSEVDNDVIHLSIYGMSTDKAICPSRYTRTRINVGDHLRINGELWLVMRVDVVTYEEYIDARENMPCQAVFVKPA